MLAKSLSKGQLQSQSHNISWPDAMLSESPQSQDMEEQLSTLGTSDLIEDAKFYQDMAIEYQNAYETLQHRYAQQAHLMEKVSGALHAAEGQASQRQQELLELQRNHEVDIQSAVGRVVFDYKEQLAAAKHNLQYKDCEHQQADHRLQDQVCALELSLASQANLPSMRHSQKEMDLWKYSIIFLEQLTPKGVQPCMILRTSLFLSRNTFGLGTGLKCLI